MKSPHSIARKVGCCLALCLVVAGCSHAPMPTIPTGIRPRAEPLDADVVSRRAAEIEAERARITASQSVEEAACYQRFAVTDCLLEVRTRYRPQLTDLNRRDVDVRAGDRERHEQERQARMEEQRITSLRDQERAQQRAASNATGNRQAEADQRNADRAAAAPGNAARAQAGRANAQQSQQKALAEQAQRAAAAPGEREQYEAKQKAAAERRAAQERRAAERKNKPAVQPLPDTPPPASPSVPMR
ncbi:hypothetical protein GN316_04400 [Xylophilus sp. Kf1]|nr:hypothetical protein [Xylophilus sp. Kf1]